MVLRGTEATVELDFFHGYAFWEPGRATWSTKLLRPFDRSARRITVAAVNLSRRMLRGEHAYPGLRTLVRDFYAAVVDGAPAPIGAKAIMAVARARDELTTTLVERRSP